MVYPVSRCTVIANQTFHQADPRFPQPSQINLTVAKGQRDKSGRDKSLREIAKGQIMEVFDILSVLRCFIHNGAMIRRCDWCRLAIDSQTCRKCNYQDKTVGLRAMDFVYDVL